ncbi:cell cycle serine/threonine-protein kinase CDC5/MSD2 [Biomphalaria glabrata]|uniref:Probable serine/threonine-protein kinase MARK-A n=1 Tax=Biomphalaria glabrata TaxID=6526 RepID=A0A9W3BIF8_BIOGL|nr:probable serine/threonine-protein kinase MARK-A [Biomphalaria glabrata]KAI8729498.1 cell cycle serine/threonine-protein kinase CDC5/MSD2-like [Biomphalaria glabrata]KAI8781316.1 cell cycle serine/threonine-protein kinase CDC5/MSD2 [Biomphalaria glabrata]
MAANQCPVIDEVIYTDVFTQFHLIEGPVLGSGTFGTVLLATSDDDPNDQMAVKMFYLHGPEAGEKRKKRNDETLNMFIKETKLMKRLKHANIMPVLSAVQTPSTLALFLPYCSRGTLMESIKGINLEDQTKYITQLCQAIHYLHQKYIVHCDIKPANILLDDNSNVLLSDFGLSRALPNPNVEIFQNFGTRFYRAPETYSDERVNPFKVDMYAFGITCWVILLKKRPANVNFVEMINADLNVLFDYKRMVTFLLVSDPIYRPTADKVLEMLEQM